MKRIILITGASSGIGYATAKLFAEKGWQVAATMRNPEEVTFPGKQENIKKFKLDVTSDNVTEVLNDVEQQLGPIDVLVNNAGFSVYGPFEFTDERKIRQQFEVNVFGLMALTKAVIPGMRTRGGIIINVSSMGGRVTFPFYSTYHSTKWAVEGFSESLLYELSDFNIRVKLIEPGVINTDFYGRSQEKIKPEGVYTKEGSSSENSGGVRGVPPENVAGTIYKAATDGSKRMRYTSGYPARLLIILRKLLPERLLFWIIRSQT